MTKRLRDVNVIPIGKYRDKTMLYTIVYEVEYQYGNNSSLAEKNIAKIYFKS